MTRGVNVAGFALACAILAALTLQNALATSLSLDSRTCVDAAWLVGALACIVFVARDALGSVWWGIAVAAPVAGDGRFGGMAGAGAGDARAAFLLALMLAIWVRARMTGRVLSWEIVIPIGLMAGFAVAANPVALAALVAYAAYLAARSTGVMRLARPAACVGVAAVMRLAVGGASWEGFQLTSAGTPGELLFRPEMPLYIGYILPAAVYAAGTYLAWRARHETWFASVAMWAASLSVVAALTARSASPATLVAMQTPVEILAVLCAITLYKSKRGGTLTVRVTRKASR